MELKQLLEGYKLARLILKKHLHAFHLRFSIFYTATWNILVNQVLVVLNDQVVINPLSNLWRTATRLV